VHVLISSDLDYAKSVLFGALHSVLSNFQQIHNSTLFPELFSSLIALLLLRLLHWLPAQSRIRCKLATIVYEWDIIPGHCPHGQYPPGAPEGIFPPNTSRLGHNPPGYTGPDFDY